MVHSVLGVPRTHRVLFLQGGASLQFAMVPMNLRVEGKPAAYVDTGAWSKKAVAESKGLGPTKVIASSAESGYDHIPAMPAADAYADASYVHVTSNNTIYGTEFAHIPKLEGGVPLICDFSSNIGSRPMAMANVAMGYAGAQKNLGPSGVTLAFIDEELLSRQAPGYVPNILRYASHAEKNSLLNTANTFGILVLRNVLRWVESQGGASGMGERNASKAAKLYRVLEGSSLYVGHARADSRSTMNVTWTLGRGDEAEAQTQRFLAAAAAAGMSGLKGHRSVGGCRASIYNAMPESSVDALCEFMQEFERRG